jgi:hypothetical protein
LEAEKHSASQEGKLAVQKKQFEAARQKAQEEKEAMTNEIAELRAKLQEAEAQQAVEDQKREEAVQAVISDKEKQFSLVEERVRAAITAKDETIRRMKTELSVADAEKAELRELLEKQREHIETLGQAMLGETASNGRLGESGAVGPVAAAPSKSKAPASGAPLKLTLSALLSDYVPQTLENTAVATEYRANRLRSGPPAAAAPTSPHSPPSPPRSSASSLGSSVSNQSTRRPSSPSASQKRGTDVLAKSQAKRSSKPASRSNALPVVSPSSPPPSLTTRK